MRSAEEELWPHCGMVKALIFRDTICLQGSIRGFCLGDHGPDRKGHWKGRMTPSDFQHAIGCDECYKMLCIRVAVYQYYSRQQESQASAHMP